MEAGQAPPLHGQGVHWVSEAHEARPLKIGPSPGPGSEAPITIGEIMKNNAAKFATKPALHVKRSKEANAQWEVWTYKQYYDEACQFARAAIHFGLQPHRAVSIIGFNSPEWFIADVGTILAGGIAAGIYTTNGPEACYYIVDHSDSVIVVVENDSHLRKFMQIRDRLDKVNAIVMWTGQPPPDDGHRIKVYSWADFLRFGDQTNPQELEQRMTAQQPSHCCTLIYTSGTTGPPKAVMISHDNCSWTGLSVAGMFTMNENDVIVSFLPLSHIAAQMVDLHAPMYCGSSVYFAQPDALKGSLANTLKEVRPTLFLGVPRVWEKIEEKMRDVGKNNTGMKKSIGNWAKGVGLHGGYSTQRGESVPWGWWLADNLVFKNVRVALGLDRCRAMASAAAPISKDTLEYFLSLGIPIMEIYGMSECTGPQTIGLPERYRTGSCGSSLPGTELRIMNPDPEGNGEICYRGRHVFMGYLHNPAATAESIDADGFLHSGDIGKLDKDQFLYITGRIKELIITAGGENIPPVIIEEEIKRELAGVISNVMVVGDRRKFLSCLITLRARPRPDARDHEYPFTDQLHPDAVAILQQNGSNAVTVQDAAADPAVRNFFERAITAANKRATSNAQMVRKFEILVRDFTVDNDALTPTLKLKRRIVVQQYADVIDRMYAEAELAGVQ